MPDRDVKTIRDLIYYQYAKLIARSAFKQHNGKAAKSSHYGFIKKTFLELKKGAKSWSDITREDWQLVESHRKCGYCGSEEGLQREHIVPRSLKINDRCPTCDRLQGIHNQVWACRPCNSKKGDKGLYEFYRDLYTSEQKFFDFIPPLLEKEYLKTIYYCHVCAETLDQGDIDGDKTVTVRDIDFILR
ncbi:MAG: HNH endonuclease [bacterium]